MFQLKWSHQVLKIIMNEETAFENKTRNITQQEGIQPTTSNTHAHSGDRLLTT
jgi:hypothetical protein